MAAERALTGRVTGVVQGVFFRAATREMAVGLGLKGWVRNTANGAVEVMLIGENVALDEMRRWLHRGPPHARVAAVDLQHCDPDPSLVDFSIRS